MTTGTLSRTFPENFVDHLRALAAARPAEVALTLVQERAGAVLDTSIGYAALDRRVRALAACLQQRYAPGERALLMLDNDDHYVVAFFACLYAGLIAVPVFAPESSRQQHLGRLIAIVRDARARCILTTGGIVAMLGAAIDGLSDVSTVAVDAIEEAAAEDWKPHAPRDEDIAFLQYTSGSTSAPKGVVVTHGNLMANERAIEQGLSVGADDVFVSWLPLFHDMGLIGGMLQPIHRGIELVLMTPRLFIKRPIRWLEAIARRRGTISGGPDFAYRLCLERITDLQLQQLDLSSWQVAFCGAEPVRRETLEAWTARFAQARFPATSLFPCYGLAEATLFVAGSQRGRGAVTRSFAAEPLRQGRAERRAEGAALVGCGRTASEHSVRIADAASGAVLEPGKVGEIWVNGPSTARGYWNNPEETRQTFPTRDGRTWLRTGDLGFVDDDQLYITGRIKDMIIVRGHNLYPQDIERAIEADVEAVHRGQVAAFAVQGQGGEGIGVAVEISHGMQKLIPPGVLVQALSAAVSELCAEPPAVVVLLHPGALPKTSSGKLQRHACRAGWAERTLRAYAIYEHGRFVMGGSAEAAELPALNELESALAAVWRQVLRLEESKPLGRDAHFFTSGGNSLAAMHLAGQVAEQWGVELDMRALFERPRLGDMAQEIQQRRAAGERPVRVVIDSLPPERRADLLPLSHAQERQWFLWQLDPQSTAYHVGIALRLRGELRVGALRAALAELVARHESLRTLFCAAEDGTPRQRILPSASLELSLIDLSVHDAQERQALAAREVQQIAAVPFDLTEAPPLRSALLRSADDDHLLVLVMHHIIADGSSLQVLIDELGARYRAHLTPASDAGALPRLPIQYVDYALWQRRSLAAGESERLLAWWRKQLGESGSSLSLPTDFPRKPRADYRAARHGFELPPSLVSALRSRADAQGATLFMALLAGFQALLRRQTGQADIRVGVPVAGRHRRGTERVVGLFVNTLVLRNVVHGRASLAELLASTKEAVLAAHAHQDLPFERLVEAARPDRSLSTSPLFQVVYNHLQEDYRALAELPGLTLESCELGELSAQFELSLDTREGPDGKVRAFFTYAAELFEPGSIERLSRRYLSLLQQLAEHPERRVFELSLIGDAERLQLKAWSSREHATRAAPAHVLIARQARRRPEATALIFGAVELSYGALDVRANRLAHRLIALGVKPEVKVGIAIQQPIEMVVGMLAVLKAGGAYLPLDPADPAERFASIVEDSGLTLLLTERRRTIPVGKGAAPVALEVDGLDLDGVPDHDPGVEVHPECLAYVIFTSGSTGRPKAVENRHAALSGHVQAAVDSYGLRPEDRLLQYGAPTFDSFVEQLFAPLAAGAAVVLRGSALWDSETFHRELVDKRISIADLTTAYWMLLVQDWARAGARGFGALRRVHVGGEALPSAGLAAWREAGLGEIELFNCYGPTEATVTATLAECGTYVREERQVPGYVPIGTPLGGRSVHVLDADLNLVPAGVTGELYIGGSLLARGYGGRAGSTAERFVADPFEPGARLYRTGDLVRWRGDGQLEYLGRTDHQLKIRGFRVEPGEIEAQLLAQPEVKEALVVAREAVAGASLVAYVSAQPAVQSLDVGLLRERLGERLPDYMIPAVFVVLDALPLSENGKVDRRSLPVPELEQRKPHEPLQGKEEETVAKIWSEVLGIEGLGRRDNFFELGGNSLLLLRVHRQIAERLGAGASVVDLFRHPTVESLAAFLRRSAAPQAPALEIEERARRQRGALLGGRKAGPERTPR